MRGADDQIETEKYIYSQKGTIVLPRDKCRIAVAFQVPVQSVPITTKVVGSNPTYGEVHSVQLYVIKFVCDLRQVGGLLQFPPPIKLTTTMKQKYCGKWR